MVDATVDGVCRAAAGVARAWAATSRTDRAAILRAMADALEARRDEIVATAMEESHLDHARLTGELTRTCFQLDHFAEVLEEGSYLEATIDHATTTPMGPRPDLRRMLVALGPVAVFGASNFPLAFSVPGGDTASALAAGCPVVLKAHPAHPRTSQLCFDAMRTALPTGLSDVLGIVFGEQAGIDLVEHPAIRAIGFTGSVAGGRALADRAAARPDPIPFYGELGSINAVVITTAAARARGSEIGTGLADSFTLGAGQYCTKPGLAFVPLGGDGDALRDALVGAADGRSFTMLTDNIAARYHDGAGRLAALSACDALLSTPGGTVGPTVLEISLDDLGAHHELLDEVFGPLLVVARYSAITDLPAALRLLPGALTATVHAEVDDADAHVVLADLHELAGRLVWNGYPTGVAVAWAQHHGGPWPSTNSIHTSVGATSIRRFLRPFAWQNAPTDVLPAELRDDHTGMPRRIDGRLHV